MKMNENNFTVGKLLKERKVLTVTFNLRGMKRLTLRMAIAKLFFKIGSWLAYANFETRDK